KKMYRNLKVIALLSFILIGAVTSGSCSVLIGKGLYPSNYDQIRSKALDEGFELEKSLPKNYSRKGDVDYTDYIQNVLNKRRVVIFPDFPLLVNDKGLTLTSNSVIVFRRNSKIYLKPSPKPKYEIFRLHNISNVYLFDLTIIGDKRSHLGKSGEFGNGISLRNAHNIKILNANVGSCWGDGIIVGSFNNKECRNIEIY